MKKNVKNVILITVDSLRADHVSFMNYCRDTTPNLRELSRRSVVFERFMSNGSYTPASFASTFSSTYPIMYGGYERFSSMRPTIAEVLRDSGYTTAAFHSNPFLSRFYGYDRGFDLFEDLIPHPPSGKGESEHLRERLVDFLRRHPVLYRSIRRVAMSAFALLPERPPYTDARTITKRAIRWIKENRSEPFFLWIHYMDVHFPYMPKKRYLKRLGHAPPDRETISMLNERITYNRIEDITKGELESIIVLYDAEILYVDEHIQVLLTALERLGLLKSTALIVTADHGEEFGEHGGLGHGAKLYNELLHIPFLLYLPELERGIRIDGRASLIDLAPTILDILGLDEHSSFMGKSLLPMIEGNEQDGRAVISEMASRRITPTSPLKMDYGVRKVACTYGNWKYIYNEGADDELYDLKGDPNETINLICKHEEWAERLRERIEQHIKLEKRMETLGERERVKEKIKKLKSIDGHQKR